MGQVLHGSGSASSETTEPYGFAKEAFDEISFFIENASESSPLAGCFPSGNYGNSATTFDRSDSTLPIIPLVAKRSVRSAQMPKLFRSSSSDQASNSTLESIKAVA